MKKAWEKTGHGWWRKKMSNYRIGLLIVSGLLAVAAGSTAQTDASKAAASSLDTPRAGWISDEACAADHTKPGRADCVEKCWRGGASIGHPEWKPQRAVFVADGNRTIWIVENPEAVKKFPAAHVLVSGKFDAEKKMLQVEKIALVQ
jgi:hypothetical protein